VAALAALLLAAGAVAAIALSGRGGDSTAQRTAASGSSTSAAKKQRTGTSSTASAAKKPTSTQAKSTPTTTSTPAAGTGGDPKALNNQGFSLIGQGNSAAAVPPLQQSVQGFRQQGRTGEIDYAFALYNLATALRATGHPADAIPLLEERLQRSNYKRDVVQRELAAAQQQAGRAAPAGQSAGKPDKAGKRGHGGGAGGD
jgi:hypothetical protein